MSGGAVAAIIAFTAVFSMCRRVELYPALTAGMESGLKTAVKIFPSVAAMLTAVYMLRACGALDAFTALAAPVLSRLGIPEQTASLMLIRPLSGTGALAFASELINTFGPDSEIGRIAAVMLGSTETTFYVIAVYFGAVGIKKSRYAIPAALIADLVGFIMAGISVRLLM